MRQALKLQIGVEPEVVSGLSSICRGKNRNWKDEERPDKPVDPEVIYKVRCYSCQAEVGEMCRTLKTRKVVKQDGIHIRRYTDAFFGEFKAKLDDIMERAKQWE